MPNQDTSEIKEKIISLLNQRGPSLPVHIANGTGLSMLFASAFLSELVSEKKVKISNTKIGNSPAYFLLGQEPLLEKFSQHLKSKEKDAFNLLKEKKFLKDITQEPAIRVALRAIKDFAIPFKKDEEIFWRHFTISENEFKIKQSEKKEINEKQPEQNFKKELIQKTQKLEIFDEPPKTIIKDVKKKKEKSEFIIKVLNFLKQNNFELLEEIEFKKREFLGIIKINTDFGKIEFLIIAKDKKKITENDLEIAIQKSQSNKKMVAFLSSGELNKKALIFLEKYKNILKFLKL